MNAFILFAITQRNFISSHIMPSLVHVIQEVNCLVSLYCVPWRRSICFVDDQSNLSPLKTDYCCQFALDSGSCLFLNTILMILYSSPLLPIKSVKWELVFFPLVIFPSLEALLCYFAIFSGPYKYKLPSTLSWMGFFSLEEIAQIQYLQEK